MLMQQCPLILLLLHRHPSHTKAYFTGTHHRRGLQIFRSLPKTVVMKLISITPRTQFSTLLRRTNLLALSSPSPRFPRSFALACSSSHRICTSSLNVNPPQSNLNDNFNVEVANHKISPNVTPPKLSLSGQAFFLLTFIVCTASVAFTGFVIAAVPTLYAMRRAAISFSKLADTAREELPSTMAAIRLSGMEISDLTLELSDLSQEISDGVTKSAQAVQAAEAGVRQISSLARHQAMAMIQERASLPIISIQPVVVGAAKKTSQAVGQATKSFISLIS